MTLNGATIRILLADDHTMVRRSLARALSREPGMAVVAEADSGLEAVEQAKLISIDVAILDMHMPGMDKQVFQFFGRGEYGRALVLTGAPDLVRAVEAVRLGVRGFVVKSSPMEELVAAVRLVYDGQLALDRVLGNRILERLARPVGSPLSKREREVMRLVGRGLDNHEIGARLGLSSETIRTHVRNIMSKLSVTNRLSLALYAVREAYVTVDQLQEESVDR